MATDRNRTERLDADALDATPRASFATTQRTVFRNSNRGTPRCTFRLNLNDFEMSNFEPIQPILSSAVQKIAEYAFPSGTRAYCQKCGYSRHATTSELAEWFAKGYPVCKCGGKISIVTPRDERLREK